MKVQLNLSKMGAYGLYASDMVLESTDDISASHYKDSDSFRK